MGIGVGAGRVLTGKVDIGVGRGDDRGGCVAVIEMVSGIDVEVG